MTQWGENIALADAPVIAMSYDVFVEIIIANCWYEYATYWGA